MPIYSASSKLPGDMMQKRALVLGCGGQDGSFMCEVLLEQGYEVYGTTRRSSVDNLVRIAHIKDKIKILRADLTDVMSLQDAIENSTPNEIYNLADQDNVGWSKQLPRYSIDVTVKGVLNLLEVCLRYKYWDDRIKIFIPVSATMFGDAPSKQHEDTRHNPLSPYACAKSAVYHLARYYRQVHKMFIAVGIMYNHHSPRRGKGYLLSDIRDKVLACKEGKSNTVYVGSLDQLVDIGYAREYMEGVHRMMQLNIAWDMILSSGRGVRIQDVVENIAYCEGVKLIAIVEDQSLRHDTNNVELIGNCDKARTLINWKPQYNASNICTLLRDQS
jgi:GDPmannose 4,6-dehydratase